MKELVQIRIDLDRRIQEIQTLGKSRESALALTTAQQGRMLLGKTLQLLGSANPYPHADNPANATVSPASETAADYVPELPEDPIIAVKTIREALEQQIAALTTFRRAQWPRDHGTLEAVVFDRALVELILAKHWLGMELARLGAKVKKPKAATVPPAGDPPAPTGETGAATGEENPASPPASGETATGNEAEKPTA